MTRCDDFYIKVEKDGNFCGMGNGEYSRLLKIRDLQAKNLDLSKLPASTLKPLVAIKDQSFLTAVIVEIGKRIKAGEKVGIGEVTKIVNSIRDLEETKEQKESTPTKDLLVTKETTPTKATEEISEEEIDERAKEISAIIQPLISKGWDIMTIGEILNAAVEPLGYCISGFSCLSCPNLKQE